MNPAYILTEHDLVSLVAVGLSTIHYDVSLASIVYKSRLLQAAVIVESGGANYSQRSRCILPIIMKQTTLD